MTPAALPLSGLRIAVTRPIEDGRELMDLLEAAGAAAVHVPLTRIAPPVDPGPLERAAANLDQYDWIVFTSVNAIRALASAPWEHTSARIAAVGPATAAAVRAHTGRDVDVVPVQFTGSALAAAMRSKGSLRNARVLWPRAETARQELPRSLAQAGAGIDDPIAYRTIRDSSAAVLLAGMAQRGEIDVITFTAPSAVDCFADATPDPVRCDIAVLGSTTAAAARARGLRVRVEPDQHIIPALVAALARFRTGGSV